MNKRVIGISGLAGSGKDTFVDLLQKQIPQVKRFALADALKVEINPYLIKEFGVDIFTCDRETKNMHRPLLVSHGKERRISSQGRYWVELLDKKIRRYLRR
jgi:dephospho-CoA kinase